MSLHIESTENALAELKKQRTKTLTAAISVSFLGIALMGLLLYLVHIIVAVPEDPPMVAYATQEGDNPDIDTPEVTQTTPRRRRMDLLQQSVPGRRAQRPECGRQFPEK